MKDNKSLLIFLELTHTVQSTSSPLLQEQVPSTEPHQRILHGQHERVVREPFIGRQQRPHVGCVCFGAEVVGEQLNFLRGKQLVQLGHLQSVKQPRAELRNGRERRELMHKWELGAQFLHHPLDQVVAQFNALQPALGGGDRVEDGCFHKVRVFGVGHQQTSHSTSGTSIN